MIAYSNRTSACTPSRLLDSLRTADPLTLLLRLGEWDSPPGLSFPLLDAAKSYLNLPHQPINLPRHLPPQIQVTPPEGFCFYAITPEQYAQAARDFHHAHHPQQAVVIGILTIGGVLSAVVAAVLEALHCQVTRYTVRPHGHPYQRQTTLPSIARTRLHPDTWHVIVDEGPGRSGSTFASVAEALTHAGVRQDRIVFLPANNPNPEDLCSVQGQQAWRAYPKFQARFQPPTFLPKDAQELSAGAWRQHVFPDRQHWPPINPQNERRKYLFRDGPIRQQAKFAGLGHYGQAKLDLAHQLAERNFTPRPRCLQDGYLVTDWIEAQPCPPITTAFLDHIADYLAFRAALISTTPGHTFDDLLQMIEVNFKEAGRNPPNLTSARSLIEDQPQVAIDNRWSPHEWLHNAAGHTKTDALDHHNDHFYPGPQDIAWDLAAAIQDLTLDPQAAAYLIEAFHRKHPTPHLPERLAFYQAAHQAFQLGREAMAPREA